MHGGAKGVRTPDLYAASVALSLLSYNPMLAGATGFEPVRCQIQSLVPYRLAMLQYGARDRTRTCDIPVVTRMLSRLSYASVWCARRDSNPQPPASQAGALPVELRAHMAVPTGLEPATSAVTGQRDDQLRYGTIVGECSGT